MSFIKNEDLKLEEIPKSLEEEVANFSHTINRYEFGGTFKGCAEVSMQVQLAIKENKTERLTLSELRTCLFFHYRALRHGGDINKARVDLLLKLIRIRVQNKKFE